MISLLPDQMIDYLIDEEGFTSKKEVTEYIQDMLDEQFSSFEELGVSMKDVKMSYEIEEEEDLRGDDWREVRDEMKEEAGIEIDAAKEIKLKLHVEYLGKENDSNITLSLVKIGRSWYVMMF